MENTIGPKHLIIHGHFYQPPRENPWTEEIERQDGAAPSHDWNERIANECYLPNALSRRLDDWGRITKLVNNYEWISFNFGPTLISWLEEKFPAVYARILEADKASAKRLDGHGNAIAQVYNHIIMPLASRRDQETQIRWGLHDFERRFSRASEGIWLSETAINAVTLEILTGFNLRFIILSPHQALRVRPLDESSGWKDVSKGTIHTGEPYRCYAPGPRGKRAGRPFIDIFFYDAALSQDISFNHLLRNGDNLASAIEHAYPRGGNDLVVIATDGEVYGHHEAFADMALSYLIDAAAPKHALMMTNFGAYLASHEARFEVELKPGPNGEGTAWSCFHGVGRWKEDCGDSTGGAPGWNQKWRAPLRAGLTSLAESLASRFEEEGSALFTDPWKARNEYIEVVEDRTGETAAAFVASHASRALSAAETARALALLESQRNTQLMFTSCGWFFADISGVETVQILRYAARAIELAGTDHWLSLEKRLLTDLKGAVSNLPTRGTGANIFNSSVKSSILSRPCLVALFAIDSHLSEKGEITDVYGNPVRALDEIVRHVFARGSEDHVKIGAVEITSRFTREVAVYEYLLYVEDEASFACYVRERKSEAEYGAMVERITSLAEEGLIDDIRPAVTESFGSRRFTIRDFLVEDRERVLKRFAAKRLEGIESRFDDIYEESKHLLLLLKEANVAAPQNLVIPAQTHLTKKLVREVGSWERSLNPAGLEGIRRIVAEAAMFGVPLDKSSAAASFSDLILEKIRLLAERLDAERAEALEQFVNLSTEMGIQTNFRDIQNRIYPILETKLPRLMDDLGSRPSGREEMKRAISSFLSLARRFNFNTDVLDKRLETL